MLGFTREKPQTGGPEARSQPELPQPPLKYSVLGWSGKGGEPYRTGRETALTSYYQSTRDEAKYPPSKSSFEQCLLLLFLEWVLLQKQHESHNLTRPPRSTANGILGAVRKTRGKQKYSARLIQRSS